MSMSNSTAEECLREAGLQLKAAMEKLEAGEELAQVYSEPYKEDPHPGFDEYDPDDLAAAFFAQQARKKKVEAVLPINDWAKVMHRRKQCKNSGVVVGGSAANESSDRSVEEKAKELMALFEAAY